MKTPQKLKQPTYGQRAVYRWVLSIAAVAALAAVYWQHLRIDGLRTELKLASINAAPIMPQQAPQSLPAPPPPPSRLQVPVTQPPVEVLVPTVRNGGASLEFNPSNWRDAGQSNPESALKTALWAASKGDLARLMQLIDLPEDVLAKARALYAAQSPELQAKLGSVESMVAAMVAVSLPKNAVTVIYRGSYGDKLQLTIDYNAFGPEADTVKAGRFTRRLTFKRAESGWKIEIPASALTNLPRHPPVDASVPAL